MAEQERSYPRAHPVARRLLELKPPTDSLAAYAETLGLSPQKLSNWLNNGDAPSYDAILELLTKNDLNPMWLLTGQPPVRRVEPEEADLRLWLARTAVVGAFEDVEALLRSSLGARGPAQRRKAAEPSRRYGATRDERTSTDPERPPGEDAEGEGGAPGPGAR